MWWTRYYAVDKNGDGIIDSEEMEDKPLPDIMTASLMYSSLDMDGDGEVIRPLFIIREHSHMSSDVLGVFLTYPSRMLYYKSLFIKIWCSLT